MKLTLRELVEELKKELRTGASEENAMFVVESATVTTKVASIVDKTAKGGLKFYILNAELQASEKIQSEHQVSLVLKTGHGQAPIIMGGELEPES